MDGVRVFEVDAHATQAEKRVRLAAAGIAVPPNVVYAAIDLARRVAALGEPLRTTVDSASLDAMLRAIGFRDVTILSPAEAARYLGERTDHLRLPSRESIAAAIV